MDSNLANDLEKFAEIIVHVGLNLQPGQRLLIGVPSALTPLESAPLVRQVTAKAYDAGARLVQVLWDDPQLRRIRLQHAAMETLEAFPSGTVEATLDYVQNGDARLIIHANDPDLYQGLDDHRVDIVSKTLIRNLKPVIDLNPSFLTNWLVIGYPIERWADKVFPDMPENERISRLWEAIFKACRVDCPDPTAAWKQHVQGLEARSEALTHKQVPRAAL